MRDFCVDYCRDVALPFCSTFAHTLHLRQRHGADVLADSARELLEAMLNVERTQSGNDLANLFIGDVVEVDLEAESDHTSDIAERDVAHLIDCRGSADACNELRRKVCVFGVKKPAIYLFADPV